jgi:hypothetical protein
MNAYRRRHEVKSLHQLVAELEERKDEGKSINDLADDVLRFLKDFQNMPSVVYFVNQRAKWLKDHPDLVPGELKYSGLTADDFDIIARALLKK